MRFLTGIALLLGGIIPAFLQGQEHQTISSDSLFNHFSYLDQDGKEFRQMDLGINALEEYGFLRNADREYRHIGNRGLAAYPLVFPAESSFGFDDGQDALKPYRKTLDSIPIRRIRRPFSELFMVIGTQDELMFRGHHAQSLPIGVDFGLNFHRQKSDGFLAQHEANQAGFDFYADYDLPSGRFFHRSLMLFNKQSAQENGGLDGDIKDSFDLFFNTNQVPVRLASAVNKQQQYLYEARNMIFLGKAREEQINDTTSRKVVDRNYFIGADLFTSWQRNRFTDPTPDTTFYGIFNRGTDSLFHVLRHRTYGYRLSLGKFDRGNGSVYKFSFRQESTEVNQLNYFSVFNNTSVSGEFKRYFEGRINGFLKMEAEYYLTGYNQTDFRLATKFRMYKGDWTFDRWSSYQRSTPDWSANHIMGDSSLLFYPNLEKEHRFNCGSRLAYGKSRTSLMLNYQLIHNYTFWQDDLLPAQFRDGMHVFTATLRQDFKFWKFHLDNTATFQQFSEPELVNLPKWVVKHSFYFEDEIFKEILLLKAGVDVRYMGRYFMPGYSPFNGQFFVQRDDEQAIYPELDVYINVRVKTVRLFMLLNNLVGRFGQEYYSAYYYPIEAAAFKAGVNWRFLE